VNVCLIAAVARNGVIGRDGGLPWRLPDDLARFKALTMGKPVVMGRRTQASLPRPLPGRTNIVVGREVPAPYLRAASVDEAIALAGDAPELWVIGGARIYEAFLPRATRLELTEVFADVEGDVYFPDWDREAFELVAAEDHAADERHAFAFRFASYRRRA
jgi:dihydrofolate reductase